jgi:hypothetical protein
LIPKSPMVDRVWMGPRVFAFEGKMSALHVCNTCFRRHFLSPSECDRLRILYPVRFIIINCV